MLASATHHKVGFLKLLSRVGRWCQFIWMCNITFSWCNTIKNRDRHFRLTHKCFWSESQVGCRSLGRKKTRGGKKPPPTTLRHVCCRRNSHLGAILLFRQQYGILISAILRNRGKELFCLYTKHYQYLWFYLIDTSTSSQNRSAQVKKKPDALSKKPGTNRKISRPAPKLVRDTQ
jgi:hypothetical protein